MQGLVSWVALYTFPVLFVGGGVIGAEVGATLAGLIVGTGIWLAVFVPVFWRLAAPEDDEPEPLAERTPRRRLVRRTLSWVGRFLSNRGELREPEPGVISEEVPW